LHSTGDAHFDCPNGDELDRDHLWWEIYENSFPAREREPASVILDSLLSHVGLAFRARRDQKTIGIATTHLLHNPAAVFLVYLAIDRAHRDAGLGGALLEYAWDISRSRERESNLEPLGMVWEVEAPQLTGDPAETMLRERRISFFRRQGGVLLPKRYIQPAVDGGAPVPMQLMLRARAQAPDDNTLDSLVHAMYFEKYGALNKISREALAMLLSQLEGSHE
jgi:GNAT superfamily N-acetyltransferase